MEATILNENFESVAILDNYKSFIWTDRYNEAGDFEVHVPIVDSIPEYAKNGYYIWSSDSEHLMIMESFKIESDIEEGTYLVISGRSLESILDRRIVWNKTLIHGPANDKGQREFPNLQKAISRLLIENAICNANDGVIFNEGSAMSLSDLEYSSECLDARELPGFKFKWSDDPRITNLTFGTQIEVTEEDPGSAGEVLYYTVGAQYHGDNLYDIIVNLCQEKYIGFKITLDDNNDFIFELYAGIDHSYGTDAKPQEDNDFVVFSKDFDNLMNTNYLVSTQKWKNVTLIGGEKEKDPETGIEKSQVVVEWSDEKTYTGLERREIFTDASNKSMEKEDENGDMQIMAVNEYKAILKSAGIDTLMENELQKIFDGEADTTTMFQYGIDKDFYMGDIIQFATEYGVEGRAYISEYIMSTESSGKNYYPTLVIIEEGEYEL